MKNMNAVSRIAQEKIWKEISSIGKEGIIKGSKKYLKNIDGFDYLDIPKIKEDLESFMGYKCYCDVNGTNASNVVRVLVAHDMYRECYKKIRKAVKQLRKHIPHKHYSDSLMIELIEISKLTHILAFITKQQYLAEYLSDVMADVDIYPTPDMDEETLNKSRIKVVDFHGDNHFVLFAKVCDTYKKHLPLFGIENHVRGTWVPNDFTLFTSSEII